MDFSSLCASFLFHFIFIFYFLSVMRVFVPLLKRSYFLFICVVDLVFYIISISCSPPTMHGERRGFRRKSKSKNETSRNQYVAHVFSRLHHKKERKRIRFIFTLFHHVFLFLLMCSIEFITVASAATASVAFQTKLHTDVFYPG